MAGKFDYATAEKISNAPLTGAAFGTNTGIPYALFFGLVSRLVSTTFSGEKYQLRNERTEKLMLHPRAYPRISARNACLNKHKSASPAKTKGDRIA